MRTSDLTFQYKDILFWYRYQHYKDKRFSRPSYLYNGDEFMHWQDDITLLRQTQACYSYGRAATSKQMREDLTCVTSYLIGWSLVLPYLMFDLDYSGTVTPIARFMGPSWGPKEDKLSSRRGAIIRSHVSLRTNLQHTECHFTNYLTLAG